MPFAFDRCLRRLKLSNNSNDQITQIGFPLNSNKSLRTIGKITALHSIKHQFAAKNHNIIETNALGRKGMSGGILLKKIKTNYYFAGILSHAGKNAKEPKTFVIDTKTVSNYINSIFTNDLNQVSIKLNKNEIHLNGLKIQTNSLNLKSNNKKKESR